MNAAPDQLRAFVERVERLEEEIAALNKDKSDIYAEAKGNGFDVPTIKKIVRIRKLDHAERLEQDALLDLYMSALGMIPSDEPSHVRVYEGDIQPERDTASSGDFRREETASVERRPTAGEAIAGRLTRAAQFDETSTAPGEPASAGEAVDATPPPRPFTHEGTSSQRPAREAEANVGGDHEEQGVAKTLIDDEAAKPTGASAAGVENCDLAAGSGSSAGGSSGVSASDVEPVAPSLSHEAA